VNNNERTDLGEQIDKRNPYSFLDGSLPAGTSTAWRKKESLLCQAFLGYHNSLRLPPAA
jgi:hypothetical protein